MYRDYVYRQFETIRFGCSPLQQDNDSKVYSVYFYVVGLHFISGFRCVCVCVCVSGESKKFWKVGAEDNLSAPSSFIANAHSEIYAFYTEKAAFWNNMSQ